ncbi:head decoration protein [Rhodobacterales bacterium 52_120_T64]|nr:head decoration protein [Rhodobacterales bacterium 52_120_T64]
MAPLVQPASLGDVLKYEVNPNYTRETITLLAGVAYPVGSVLGRITASGKFTLASDGGVDGAEVAAALLLYSVDAMLADTLGVVIVRGPAIISPANLTFDASVDDATKTATKIAELAALGIIARNAA